MQAGDRVRLKPTGDYPVTEIGTVFGSDGQPGLWVVRVDDEYLDSESNDDGIRGGVTEDQMEVLK